MESAFPIVGAESKRAPEKRESFQKRLRFVSRQVYNLTVTVVPGVAPSGDYLVPAGQSCEIESKENVLKNLGVELSKVGTI